MQLNLCFQHGNCIVLHWKHGKVWRESVSPMFHVTFLCGKHGFKHEECIGKHTGKVSLVYFRIIQCINNCRIDFYKLLKTRVLPLLTHVFNIDNQGRLLESLVFTMKYTCKTERKHRNEHG